MNEEKKCEYCGGIDFEGVGQDGAIEYLCTNCFSEELDEYRDSEKLSLEERGLSSLVIG